MKSQEYQEEYWWILFQTTHHSWHCCVYYFLFTTIYMLSIIVLFFKFTIIETVSQRLKYLSELTSLWNGIIKISIYFGMCLKNMLMKITTHWLKTRTGKEPMNCKGIWCQSQMKAIFSHLHQLPLCWNGLQKEWRYQTRN